MISNPNVSETELILKEYEKVMRGLKEINDTCKAFENLTEDEDFKAVFENISTALTASVEQANGVVKDKFAELFARR